MYSILSKIALLGLLSLFFSLHALSQNTAWGVYTAAFTYDDDRFLPNTRLPGLEVSGMGTDSKGSLYLGIHGAGVYRLDKGSDKYLELKAPREVKVFNINITALVVDKADRIWAGTSRGLAMFDGTDWVSYEKNEDDGFPFKSVSELYLAPDGKLYVSGFSSNMGIKGVPLNGAGLAVYDQGNWTVYNTENSDIPFDFVAHMIMDKAGILWMTAGREDEGLLRFDGKTFQLFNKAEDGLPNNMIRDIAVAPNGDLLIGTMKGIFRKTGEAWEQVLVTEESGSNTLNKLNAAFQPDVRSLAVDAKGTIWAGIYEEGIAQIKNGKLRSISMENAPVTSKHIQKIICAQDGKIWFLTGLKKENLTDAILMGTQEGGFNGLFSMQENDFKSLPGWTLYHTQNTTLDGISFREMAAAPGGKVWCANGGNELIYFDGKEWTKKQTNIESILAGVHCVALGDDGTVYAGSQGKGMEVYKNGQFTTYDKKNSEVGDVVIHLETAPGNVAWYATYQGVSKFADGKVEVFSKKTAGLPTNIIVDIATGADGSLWYASQKGVGRYHEGKWTFWDKKNSKLPGNFVETICAHSANDAWAISRRGMLHFDGSEWQVIENILGIEYGFTVIEAGPNGKVYLGTEDKGLLVYDGASWKQYHDGNSALYFPRINSLTVSADGIVWINNTVPVKTLSPGVSTVPGATAVPPSPEDILRKQIADFNPSGMLLRWKE